MCKDYVIALCACYNSLMKKLILASKSNARKELLSSLGISFDVIPTKVDEKAIRDTDLKVRAQKIANAKAEKISMMYPDAVVIACDTFSECEGKVFEKPKTKLEAKKMLKFLSGKKAVDYTAFRYIDKAGKIDFAKTVKISYTFRRLYLQEIEVYVKNFPVTEWAAAFALVLPYINTFIANINGSLTGLAYGLPTELLIPLLKKSGFELTPRR